MSLQIEEEYKVPAETVRVAQAIYPEGNLYMRLYDTFGTLFVDQDFVSLYAADGQPAFSPVRLALVSILQYMEGLTDRQAADAVRTRIDWKYLLCLELTDRGFHHSILSEFRRRLLAGSLEQMILDKLLSHCREQGLLKVRGQQRTDSTHVLGAIRATTRLESVGETLRAGLNALAIAAPAWMRLHSHPDWVKRYGPRIEEYRLPTSKAERRTYAETVGADGLQLLNAIYASDDAPWLRQIPAVETLRQVWVQNFTWTGEGRLRWRSENEIPPASRYISSPYDSAARYSRKGTTSWTGYKVHLTETCDADAPHLIMHVETTPAPIADDAVTPLVHKALQDKDLLPATHIVDTGYVDAKLLVDSQTDYGVDLVGPTRHDYHWQAQQGQGFAAHDFHIDWPHQQATCPGGHTSRSWSSAVDKWSNEVIKIKFASRDCRPCPLRSQCTRAKAARRTLTIRPQAQHLALQTARARETTADFKQLYAHRAGIEGTISQGVRAFNMRRTRYRGLAKTHLQHILTATAINVSRMLRWLEGEPFAQTRQSAFVRLCAVST